MGPAPADRASPQETEGAATGPRGTWASEAGRRQEASPTEIQEAASLSLDFRSPASKHRAGGVHLAVEAPRGPQEARPTASGASNHPAKPGAEGAGAPSRLPSGPCSGPGRLPPARSYTRLCRESAAQGPSHGPDTQPLGSLSPASSQRSWSGAMPCALGGQPN